MPMELNEAQKKFLRDNAEEMFRVFALDDADLTGSECSCCAEKREFLEKLAKAGS